MDVGSLMVGISIGLLLAAAMDWIAEQGIRGQP